MNVSEFYALAAAAKQLTWSERGIAAAKVILTGFVVVFAMLIFLILIIKAYGFIIASVQNRGKKKTIEKVGNAEKTEKAAVAAPSPQITPAPEADGVSEEIAAVISAAVAAMYGSSEKVRIKSIKKSSGGRSAWANAGVLNNTRPF